MKKILRITRRVHIVLELFCLTDFADVYEKVSRKIHEKHTVKIITPNMCYHSFFICLPDFLTIKEEEQQEKKKKD